MMAATESYPADVKVDLGKVAADAENEQPQVPYIILQQRRQPSVLGLIAVLSLTFLFFNQYHQLQGFDFFGSQAYCLSPFNPPQTRGAFRENRAKVLAQLKSSSQAKPNEWALLLGNELDYRSNSDTSFLFRQDSNFLYVSGFNVPDASLLINVDSGYSVLFVRRKSRSEIIFDGGVDDFEALKLQTDTDEVLYDDEIQQYLSRVTVSNIHVISTSAADARFPELSSYPKDGSRLLSYLFLVRQVKTEVELELLRVSSAVSSRAHEAVMKLVKPGLTESDLESEFLFDCYNCGLRFQSYIGIFGSGKNGAVLHYINNNSPVNDGDIVLVDAAGEYLGYTSDITRTFPANGRFTPNQRVVYSIVLDAQKAAIAACAPGVSWSTITSTANRVLAAGLIEAGFLVGSVDEILANGVLSTFYPHGLGHPVGLDVHDPTPSPWILAYNQVFTIEPGIYFVEMLINEAKENARTARFYNFDLIDLFISFGGVRIEDVVRITSTGYEVLTTVPKEINDIEALMNPTKRF